MPDYELRYPQLEMIGACASVIENGGVLIAEAGTGTGKTFAYLIPLILSGKKGIVSTRTINLQEQLFSKDLRFLFALKEFDYAIAKGRGNYLCLRRLNAYRASNEEESGEYRRLVNWASKTRTGDLEDYPYRSLLYGTGYIQTLMPAGGKNAVLTINAFTSRQGRDGVRRRLWLQTMQLSASMRCSRKTQRYCPKLRS